MGEFADDLLGRYGYPPDDAPSPEDYLDMTDAELRAATAACRTAKLKSIRAWPHALSAKQRYCLADWLAKRDSKA
jgi:hypothetical protein